MIVVLRDLSSCIVILFNIRNNHCKTEHGDKPLTSEFLNKLHLKYGKHRRTFHWTERRPSRKAIPVFHALVWLTIPSVPKTKSTVCLSGVIAKRVIMITGEHYKQLNHPTHDTTKLLPRLTKTNPLVSCAKWRVDKELRSP